MTGIKFCSSNFVSRNGGMGKRLLKVGVSTLLGALPAGDYLYLQW